MPLVLGVRLLASLEISLLILGLGAVASPLVCQTIIMIALLAPHLFRLFGPRGLKCGIPSDSAPANYNDEGKTNNGMLYYYYYYFHLIDFLSTILALPRALSSP